MSKEEYRDSVYWGSGLEGKWYKVNIDTQVKNDVRFRGSLMSFVRYCVKFTLHQDKSLKSVLKMRAPTEEP